MEVARIDGIKTHLDRLSDEELAAELMYAAERIDRADADMLILQNELHRRTNTPLELYTPLGHTAIGGELTDPRDIAVGDDW